DQRLCAAASLRFLAVAVGSNIWLTALRSKLVQPAADHLHARIHFVRFGILHLEVSPVATANERSHLTPPPFILPVMLALVELFEPRGRQRPLGHFAVAAFRNIYLADRRHLLERFRGRDDTQPAAVFNECVEQPAKPAVIVNMFFGTWPDAELFAVVAE